MTQNTQDKNEAAEERSQDTRRFVRQVKSATRGKYTPRREDPHSPRRLWSRGHSQLTVSTRGHQAQQLLLVDKEFKETDKQRLSRDMTRDATRQEDNALKRESEDLKDLVAELSLDLHRLKKTSTPTLDEGGSSSGEGRVYSRLQAQGSGKAWSIQERLLSLESQTRARKP